MFYKFAKENFYVCLFDLFQPHRRYQKDYRYIAVPSFGGRVPETAAARLKSLSGQHTLAVLIVVYGNRAYEDTLIELSDIVSECSFLPVAAVTAL